MFVICNHKSGTYFWLAELPHCIFTMHIKNNVTWIATMSTIFLTSLFATQVCLQNSPSIYSIMLLLNEGIILTPHSNYFNIIYRNNLKSKGNFRTPHLKSNTNSLCKRFLNITTWDPSVCQSNQLHVDIFQFFNTNSKYILEIPLKWSLIFRKSWTSTGYFSNSTG